MIYRIDVAAAKSSRDGNSSDPVGESIRQQISEWGVKVGPITTRRIFLLDTDASAQEVNQIATELLADPVVESAQVIRESPHDNGSSRIEVHLKPGVMDPVAASTEMAIRDMGVDVKEVRTGRSYLISGKLPREELERIASRVLANGVVESVHFQPFIPREFPRGHAYEFKLRRVDIRKLSDEQLMKLSREGHLFLSLTEMKAIQNYFVGAEREPTDIELETLAQTWSEHCVHKTLKSAVDLEIKNERGETIETRHYDNLIRDTIFKSTTELMKEGKNDFCLSVFEDN